MSIPGAVVLFCIIWWMVLFLILPLKLKSQDEAGDVVPGTPRSAPVNPNLGKKALLITAVTTVVWAVLCAIIWSGVITIDMFNLFF